MKTRFYVTEKENKIPVIETVDVLVLGGGPAGFAAALAAARNGAKTMIIEQQNIIGGVATAGSMSHWTGDSSSKIYHEILNESAKRNENIGNAHYKDAPTILINPEKLKLLMLDLLIDAGVIIRLYTFVSDVIMDNNRAKGVIIESKSGREAVMASVLIDGTGDGDVAYKCGAEYVLGRKEDSAMQPSTLMFKVAGVDYSKAVFLGSFESTYQTENGELQDLAGKKLTKPAGHVLLYKSTLPGVVTCNMTNLTGIDGTKAEDLTRSEIVCRHQIEEIVDFLRAYVPGYENCFVISSASLIGIRETRHFKGLYAISEDDILAARVFDDWILKEAMFNFDVHNITGNGLDKTGSQAKFTQKNGYSIPIGCLIPAKINGLLLSGRNISGTHIAHSNYRAMPICVGTGEAAGVTAAIAVKNNIDVCDVSAADVQNIVGSYYED